MTIWKGEEFCKNLHATFSSHKGWCSAQLISEWILWRAHTAIIKIIQKPLFYHANIQIIYDFTESRKVLTVWLTWYFVCVDARVRQINITEVAWFPIIPFYILTLVILCLRGLCFCKGHITRSTAATPYSLFTHNCNGQLIDQFPPLGHCQH